MLAGFFWALALVMMLDALLLALLTWRRVPRGERGVGWILTAVFVLLAGVLAGSASVAAVPAQAEHYRSIVTRTARAEMGLGAPVATFAAQIQQESAWRPQARSHAGAQGLAQFMPATASWMGEVDARLHPADVYNPGWAVRAMVVYDLWLLARVRGASTCERWAFVLSAYNGGLGWVQRDVRLARGRGLDGQRWWGHVATVNAGRSAANWRENRAYPDRILQHWEPQFAAAGWGPGVCQAREGA